MLYNELKYNIDDVMLDITPIIRMVIAMKMVKDWKLSFL